MSVIAWDGKTMAADRQVSYGNMIGSADNGQEFGMEITKIAMQRQYAQAPEGVAARVAATMAGLPVCVSDDPPSVLWTLPIGSVQFLHEGLRCQGAGVPEPIDYPLSLERFLHRRIDRMSLRDASKRAGVWVKPCAEKAFDQGTPQALIDAGVDTDELVWASDTVEWLCEYRCYVCRGKMLWMHRYDHDGADDAPEPSLDAVRQMIAIYEASREAPAGYGLDIGVLSTGETALVEANDGYGLGYYGPIETVRANGWLWLMAERYLQLVQVALR